MSAIHELTPSTTRVSGHSLPKHAKDRVLISAPNKGLCCVELSPSVRSIEFAHVVPRRLGKTNYEEVNSRVIHH